MYFVPDDSTSFLLIFSKYFNLPVPQNLLTAIALRRKLIWNSNNVITKFIRFKVFSIF